MPRVYCDLPNASELIGGIKFDLIDGRRLSEEIDEAQAARLASIPGYELEKEVDEEAEKLAAEAVKKAEADKAAAEAEEAARKAAEEAEKAAKEAAEKTAKKQPSVKKATAEKIEAPVVQESEEQPKQEVVF